jgi:hypothetical protein
MRPALISFPIDPWHFGPFCGTRFFNPKFGRFGTPQAQTARKIPLFFGTRTSNTPEFWISGMILDQ